MLDIFDEESSDDSIVEIPKEVRKLRTQPYDKCVDDLVSMIDKAKICPQPSFQRKSVWDNKRASVLIESIWLNIPIPQIFVSVEENGMWNVIDGQQRITSLNRYFKDEFRLRGLEVLPELNGKLYSELEEKPKRLLDAGNIRIVAIHEDSHPDIKFDVFMRINQGAIQLNPQELRNCLYRGSLNDMLHEAVQNSNLLQILNLQEPHNRMKDVEMMLRYLAISQSFQVDFKSYPGVMKSFLNHFMRDKRDIKPDEKNEMISKVYDSLEKVFLIFGKNSFRKWDSDNNKFDNKVNLSLMDCQLIAVEGYSKDTISKYSELLLEKFKLTFDSENNDDFLDSITSGTSNKNKLNIRIAFFNNLFTETIGKRL